MLRRKRILIHRTTVANLAWMSTLSPAADPPKSRPPSYMPVLLSGLATTALALFGVYWLDIHDPDFHIMGWYADFLIPVGALIVGAVAASGYGIASWVSGIKIVRALVWTVLFFQFCAYFGAQYIEYKQIDPVYRDTGEHIGFWKYFDLEARMFAWKQSDGSAGTPLGIWGYAFRGLEILGFAFGGMIVPAVMMANPYCEGCRRYMKYRSLGTVPGSVPERKIKKDDAAGQAAYQAEQQNAAASAQGLLGMLRQMAAEGRADDFRKAVEPLKVRGKAIFKLPVRYDLGLSACKGCGTGSLRIWQVSGRGKQIQRHELPRSEVSPGFSIAMLAKK